MNMKEKKIVKLIMGVLLILLIGISVFVYATQEIKIAVTQTPNVDIILTKYKTQVELKDFQTKLEEELIRQKVMTKEQIEAGKLNVSAIDAQTIETQEKLDWVRSVSSEIGEVTFDNNGKNVSMKGNFSKSGKNAIYIIPENSQEQEFKFGYSIDFGDSFNAAGMLLRVEKQANNHLRGYLLSFNKSDKNWKSTSNANAALWYFDYDNVNTTSFSVVNKNGALNSNTVKLIDGIGINPNGTLNVKITDKDIKISGGGLSSEYVYTFKSGEEYGSGYGFFSDHYSHGCNQYGQFSLTNINLKVEVIRKFTEVLQAPTWRDGATKILINVEDGMNEQFSDSDELKEIVAKLMNDNIYYIGWGTNTNREQIEELLKKNDNNGIFIENSSDEAVEATVKYIKSLMTENSSNIIIAREPTIVQVIEPVTGVQGITKDFPDGAWRVEHDYEYYENPQAQYEYDGMYSKDLITEFENVGKYTIYYEDEYVTDIYAHRRPVSAFNVNLNGEQLTLKSTSYDLDIEVNSEQHDEQKKNKGIQSEKWEYKKIDGEDSKWTEIQDKNGIGEEFTTQLDPETDYMIKLTITDYQGVSTSSTKFITTGESTIKPIALFKVVEKKISKYEELQIIDESYDPAGAKLTYDWKLKKQGANEIITEGDSPVTDYETYGAGTYTIDLTVSKTINIGAATAEVARADVATIATGTQTITSDVFSQTIEITEDTTAPDIIIEPTNAHVYNEDINVKVKFKDEESGLKEFKYVFSKEKDEILNKEDISEEIKTEELSEENDEKTLTIPAEQWDEELYLHIIATNNSDVNSEERIVGKYYIEPTYKLVIQAVDSESKNPVKDAEYNVQGEFEDGTIVDIANNVKTDGNGKITIDKAKLHKVVGIKIDNITAASGYELASYVNVGIDTSKHKIELDKSSTSSDVTTKVSEDEKELTVKVELQRKQFELKITNIDSISRNYISNTEFSLQQNGVEIDKGKTENGELILKGYIEGVNKTGDYIVVQESINSLYTKIETIKLSIKFDENGEVEKVSQGIFTKNSAVEIPDEKKSEIIVKNERIDNTSFGVIINVKESGTDQVLEGSSYKVRVESEDGLDYITEAQTSDKDGNITIDGLYGTGLLRITFIHDKAPEGYAIDAINKNIAIRREIDQTIKFESESENGIFDKTENGKIYVNLKNSLKTIKNAIKIRILQNGNKNVGIDGVGLQVYEALHDTLIGRGKTDKDGLFEIDGITVDGEGDVIYKIVPDDNTVLSSTILFTVGYNKNKRIVSANNVAVNKNVNVYYSNDDDEIYYKNTANVDIGVENTQALGNEKLIITKQDALNHKALKDAQYQVKILTTPMITNIITTDNNGIAETYLPDINSIIIQFREVQNPVGYRADETIKTIVLTRNENGTLEVSTVSNIDQSKVTIDSNGNVNVLEESESIDGASVSFKIAAVNEDGSLNLGGVKFEITEPLTGYDETLVTDANGYVTISNNFKTTDGKSYTFEIEETDTIYPYLVPTDVIKVQVRFTKNGTIVEYKGTSYLQGSNLLKQKGASYDPGNNQVNISLKVINSLDQSKLNNIYDIDLVKVDKNGNVVSGSKYNVEIRPYAESSIVSNACEVITGTEISNLAIKQDKTTIFLKEVTPAIGCYLDSDIKVVTIGLDNGSIVVLSDTTSSQNIKSEIVTDPNNGRTILRITITAEDPDNSSGTGGSQGGSQGGQTGNVPTPNATLKFKIYNRAYGSWQYNYIEKRRNGFYCSNCREYHYYHYYSSNCIETLSSSQRLLRIFDAMGDSNSYGFRLINAADIQLEARLVNNDGTIDTAIYETIKAKSITASNEDGTHLVELFKDYTNKKVEFTLIENIPEINYKRNTTDAKFIVQFDGDGNVVSGNITNGIDLEDFAIGGISAGGVLDNIIINDTYVTYNPASSTYKTYDINKYNSIGKNVIYLGLLNKAIESNPLKIQLSLKDNDTNDLLTAPVSIVVIDEVQNKITENISETIEGKKDIILKNTYENRKLLISIQQTAPGTRDSLKYLDNSRDIIQFEVEFGDGGELISFNKVNEPSYTKLDYSKDNAVMCDIYSSIWYNFAINLTKLDENGQPLQGVRVKTITSMITDNTTFNTKKVFEYGSQLTDENGKVKLKIVLPESGDYKYYGKSFEIQLDEYYVPDNYVALTGKKIKVLFDGAGKIQQKELVQSEGDDILTFTGENNINSDDIEKTSLDLNMVNTRITEKPSIEIENVDLDNEELKLEGTKYQIEVMDNEDYTINNLNINETKFSPETDSNGNTNIKFDNAHALRTMIYKIKEIKTSESYKTNNDIILKVVYDEQGKIKSKPTIIEPEQYKDPKNQLIDVARVEGDSTGKTNIKLKIVNELKPRFTINIVRQDTEGNTLTNRQFRVVAEEKDSSGNYTQIEERNSHENINTYEVGFKQDPASKTIKYTIYETTGNTETKRGWSEIQFDSYGNVESGSAEGDYIKNYTIIQDVKYINITIEAEKFRIKIDVVDKTESKYSLAGYTFKVTNSKGEESDIKAKTNSLGSVIELVGDSYKGETIKYTIEQIDSPIDYNDINKIELEVVFNSDGTIKSCTPQQITDLYDLVTTVKQENISMQIKIYTTPATRNILKMGLTDEDTGNAIDSSQFEVYETSKPDKKFIMIIERGQGETDIGSYKNYADSTRSFTIVQKEIDNKYMINDNPIQISVTFDDDGIISDARVIATDGYVAIDTAKTTGTSDIVLSTKNIRKTAMDLEVHSTQSTSDKVENAKFKIIQEDKSDLYSDTITTDIDGKATAHVGPLYKDQVITYIVKNTVQAREFKKLPDAKFTLTYDPNGDVTKADIPTEMQSFMTINISPSSGSDIEIIMETDPLLTIGVNAVDEIAKNKLVGGKYEIQQVNNSKNKDTVITNANKTAHAVIGETEKAQTINYNIIEKDAPTGYKFRNKDKVIGTLELTFDTAGRIISSYSKITNGYDFISIDTSTDKNANYDIDLIIEYEETEEFKVIIENIDIVNDNNKIQSTFNATLSREGTQSVTTDPTTGLGAMNFGQIKNVNTTQTLTISQSNIQGNYMLISQIRINIVFDESGKIKSVQAQSANGIAQVNQAYVIDYASSYTIKITVKNNPKTIIKIVNVSDGTNQIPIQSTLVLSGNGIDPVTMTTDGDGKCETILTSVPKNTYVYYTIAQTSVQKGYTKNKDIRLYVNYDKLGKISNAYIYASSQSYADLSVVTITYRDAYEIDLKITNKTIFEIYVEAQDAYDSNIKLSNVSVEIWERTYSNNVLNLKTDTNGVAHSELASTYAGHSLVYNIKINNNINGYDASARNIEANVRVDFDGAGNVIGCTSSNSLIDPQYGSGNAIQVIIKYRPILKLNITRRNTATNVPLNGRQITISSSALSNQNINPTRVTNANGYVGYDNAGLITGDAAVEYRITEQNYPGYSSLENMGTIILNVRYDEFGKIADVTSNDSQHVTTSGKGTRILDVEIGSDAKASISIVNTDYYINTERIKGTFEIKSSKGESLTLASTTGTTNIIGKLGKLYPGETIDYIVHQTEAKYAYQIIPDTRFTVQYNNNGTIGEVKSTNTDVLEIKQVNQRATEAQANINIEIHSKPILMVNLNVFDKQYNSGVYGIGFKIKDEKSGYETIVTSITDEKGNVTIPVDEAYENETVKYTITQTKNYGGYKPIQGFQVIVQYGPLGTIVESGTYVINTTTASVTQDYSEDLYTRTKQRGIQIKIEAETELGIGIEKTDVDDNIISGVEFTIQAQEVDTTNQTGQTGTTNDSGEISKYFGDLPAGKVMEYTISEVQAPAGCRKIDDVILRVYFDSKGRITSYTTIQSQQNVSIEVATDKLIRMTDSREAVHIKLKVVNDNRVTFKLINKENNVGLPIKGSEFKVSIETADGIIKEETLTTDINGEIILENISASGRIEFNFNQLSIPEGYNKNIVNSGFLTINKSTDIYKLTYEDSNDNLTHNIDSQKGIVTVELYNDNDLLMKITDVDSETEKVVTGATHKISAQYGDKTDDESTILNGTNNVLNYNGGDIFESEKGLTNAQLGNTYSLANKKVIYKITTVDTPEKLNTDDANDGRYAKIGEIFIIVEYDSKGRIETINGNSSRLIRANKEADHVMNIIIGYGDIDFYTLRIVKEDVNGIRINNAKFDINFELNNNNVEKFEGEVTSDKYINTQLIESGLIEKTKLRHEGKAKISLTETEAPEGYDNSLVGKQINVEFDVSLDKSNPDNILLNVDNINSPDADVNVNKQMRQITIIIKNNPIIKFKLSKQDENSNMLNGMKFNMIVQEKGTTNTENFGTLTTDDLGVIEQNIINKYSGKSILIRLDEIKDVNYVQIDPIIIECYINDLGKIQTIQLNSGSDSTTITTNTENSIEIKVINKLEELAKPYSINITKVDKNDQNIKLKDVLFQVKVKPSTGISVYKAVSTDDDGNIYLEGLIGSGDIEIELREAVTPEGYITGGDEGYFYYKITKVNGSLQKVSSNADDLLWNIDNDNKVVNIKVENETAKTGIAFEKVDNKNKNLKIKGATLELIETATNKKYQSVTNNDGIAYFLVETGKNITNYTIQEIEAPDGYDIDKTKRNLIIQYNNEGKITNVISDGGLTLLQNSGNYICEQLTNKQKNLGIDPYNLEIINIDRDNNSVVIPNSTFDIDITQNFGAPHISTTAATNDDGKINVSNINGAGDITIKLVNTNAGQGYIINNDKNYVKINRNSTTGTISIIETNNVTAEYDASQDLVRIYVESVKQQNKYTLKLNIIDRATGDAIKDTTAKYKISINNVLIEKNVNSNGQIILQDLDIEEVQNFKILVQELQSPSGFVSITDDQEVEIGVTSIYDTRILENVNITSGKDIQIGNSSDKSVELNILYNSEDANIYYIRSDVYEITDTEVKLVQPNTTVEDFMNNIDTNGSIKVCDKNGNEKSNKDIVKTGDVLKSTFDGIIYEYTISVIGEEPDVPEEYYIKSEVYDITDKNISNVQPDTTIKDFLGNIETNGSMKVYDKNGKEKTNTDIVETGDILKSTYDGKIYEYTISVNGDDNPEEYYIRSNLYLVTDKTIERVKPNTTIRDFFANIDTNGDMKVFDLQGKEKNSSDLVGTGDILRNVYNGVVYEYQIAVLGDLDGNGKITATDISALNQVLVEKLQLKDIETKAADLDFNGKISISDFSALNQAFAGKIVL